MSYNATTYITWNLVMESQRLEQMYGCPVVPARTLSDFRAASGNKYGLVIDHSTRPDNPPGTPIPGALPYTFPTASLMRVGRAAFPIWLLDADIQPRFGRIASP